MKFYSVSRLLLTGLTSLLLLIVIVPGIVFASSNDWSEVTRFTGYGNDLYTTNYFTCDHVDWRIRWEYIPADHYYDVITSSFIVYVYERNQIVDTITGGGEVEVTLSWHPSVESFVSDPGKKYVVITLDGNVTNLAEFPVYNTTLKVTFSLTITTDPDDHWDDDWFYKFEFLNIDTMSPNSTRQISETFFYEVDSESTGFRYDHSTEFHFYSIEWDQSDKPNGVSHIYGQAGTFYMVVDTNVKYYTIIVEQDLNSIPEFSSWILLTLFLTATVFALVVRRRINHNSGL